MTPTWDLEFRPHIQVDQKVQVSPGYYAVYEFNPSKMLLNWSQHGIHLAILLWHSLLQTKTWGNQTTRNMGAIFTCIEGTQEGISEEVFRLATVMGIASVVSIVEKPGWHLRRTAWSLWELSDSQFFYMRFTSLLCSDSFSKTTVNSDFKFNQDFCASFNCSSSSPMCNRSACPTWQKLDSPT